VIDGGRAARLVQRLFDRRDPGLQRGDADAQRPLVGDDPVERAAVRRRPFRQVRDFALQGEKALTDSIDPRIGGGGRRAGWRRQVDRRRQHRGQYRTGVRRGSDVIAVARNSGSAAEIFAGRGQPAMGDQPALRDPVARGSRPAGDRDDHDDGIERPASALCRYR
jgi:hypothetical protein